MLDEVERRLVIPASWIHADLQKLRQRYERRAMMTQLDELEDLRRCAEAQVGSMEQRTGQQRARIERLTAELQNLSAELAPQLSLLQESRRVAAGMRNQLHYQKSISRGHYFAGSFSSAFAPRNGVGQPALRGAEPCPLSVYAFPLFFGSSLGAPAERAGTSSSSEIVAFLSRSAPLFQWSGEEGLVKPPLFFDEPCLMECNAGGALTDEASSTAATVRGECRNAACPYWHRDQLSHMKMAAQFFVDSMQCMTVLDEELCDVTRLIARVARQVQRANSLSGVSAFLCETLQVIIGRGLHRQLLANKQSADSMMSAPILKAEDALLLAPSRAQLLRNCDEVECWRAVEQRCTDPSTHSVAAAVAAHVQVSDSAVSWRCTFSAVSDVEQRLWLARHGVSLYPQSPQLHLQLVLAVLESKSGVSEVITTCMTACRTLSAQASASVIVGLDGGRYATMVARHIAYMLVQVFLYVANADGSAATAFLAPLLSTEADATVTTLLLPVARQNLLLMMVALRRHGHLRHVDFLPLAAISDYPFELALSEGEDPTEHGREVLYAAMRLVKAYKRDNFAAHLIDACDGALQLSLLRTFAHRFDFVERVVEKTFPDSALAQGVLYCAYVSFVAQQQSVRAATHVGEELLLIEGSSCTLTLLLFGLLHTWGTSLSLDGLDVLHRFCTLNSLAMEDLDDSARIGERLTAASSTSFLADRRGSPPIEWVSAFLLRHSIAGGTFATADARWTRVAKLPVEKLLWDVPAAALYFRALLGLCFEGRNDQLFGRTVERCLLHFRELHLHSWSALDSYYHDLIGMPHYISLLIYREVPLALGSDASKTSTWRRLVLEVASRLGVLHPFLRLESA